MISLHRFIKRDHKMEFRIFTAFVIAHLFISLIQVAVAPAATTPPDTKKLDLLLKKKNAAKVSEVFFLAAQNKKDEARAKIVEYGEIPAELKTILDNIAKDPWKVQGEVFKPMLKETDKKFASKSLAYRMVVKPLWHVVKGITYIAGKLVGSAVMSAGDILQVVASATKEGVVAHEGKPLDATTEQTLNDVDKAAKAVQDIGQNVSKGSQRRLEKVTGKSKNTPGNADTSAAEQGVKPPSVRRQDSPPPVHRQDSPPPIRRQDSPPSTTRQDSLSNDDKDPHRQESASPHQKDGSTNE